MQTIITIAAILAIAVGYVLLPTFLSALRRLRGQHVVQCPETLYPATVEFDVGRSAASVALGSTKLHIGNCSRWPAHDECDQHCIRGVGADRLRQGGVEPVEAQA